MWRKYIKKCWAFNVAVSDKKYVIMVLSLSILIMHGHEMCIESSLFGDKGKCIIRQKLSNDFILIISSLQEAGQVTPFL